MISVVKRRELLQRLLRSPSVFFSHCLNLRYEVFGNFLFRNAADGGVGCIKTDVAQIIENREERNLSELSDARDEDEAFVLVLFFQDGKHGFIDGCAGFMLRSLPGMLQWRIILINEDNRLFSGLLKHRFDDVLETYGKGNLRAHRYFILLFKFIEGIIEIGVELFGGSSSATHVESNDGIAGPFFLQFHHFQSFEEFLFPLEVSLECIHENRLTEAAWAAQVIIRFISVGKLPDNICLVNIKISTLSDFFKGLDAYWQSSIVHFCHNLISYVFRIAFCEPSTFLQILSAKIRRIF